jgi:hypothetical protein
MFVKDRQIIILMKKGHQHDAKEEKGNKIQEFSKNVCFVDLFIRTCAIGTDLC